MSQTFQTLKCYQCHTFQVQIKKKSNRWACKLCGEKQSLVKIYGEGSSKDCRIHVQKLNNLRGAQEEAERAKCEATEETEEGSAASSFESTGEDATGHVSGTLRSKSKWSTYLENEPENGTSDEEEEETSPPETVHSKVSTVPNSKWAAYVETDSTSMTHGVKNYEADQMTLSKSGCLMEGQSSQALNPGTEAVENCGADFYGNNSTPQHKSDTNNDTNARCYKRRSSGNSISSASKKLCEVDSKSLECSGVNTKITPQRTVKKDHAKIFNSTKSDEVDELLKL